MNTAREIEENGDTIVHSCTTKALMAQLIMIDFPGTELTSGFIRDYSTHPWGGVILFTKNIESEKQVENLTARLQEISHQEFPQNPMLISVDHEGGIVSRFSFPTTVPLCGNMALGAAGKAEYAYESGKICASDLHHLGINLNFAPVVDVNNNPANPIIGARSFGESPQLVSELGKAYIRGLTDGGIIAAAKHFPGHGDTSRDSHSSLPSIPHSAERLMNVEIVPFRGAIEVNVGMIMTAHITFPALEPEQGLPATLSRRILRKYLREELGYDGVIITDSMAMKAITDSFGYEEASIKAFEAGADMVLLCGTEEQQKSALKALVDAVDSGRLSRDDLTRSFKRLYRLRASLSEGKKQERSFSGNRDKMRSITRETITLVRNEGNLLPLGNDKKITLITPDLFPLSPLGEAKIRPTLQEHMKKRYPHLTTMEYRVKTGELLEENILQRTASADCVIYASYCNGRLPETHRETLRELFGMNQRLVLASLNSPYALMDIPDVPAYINCYNYGDFSMEALSAVLAGEYAPSGRLPVSLPGLYEAGHSLTYLE
jgi:beta-N-acetylhexosaminidase